MTTAYTDTQRLDFLVCHSPDLPLNIASMDYRKAIDVLMDRWNERLDSLAHTQATRFADGKNPQGFKP